jgi:hypothetical protein
MERYMGNLFCCPVCKGQGKMMSIGMIENECDLCGKAARGAKKGYKLGRKLLLKYIANPIRVHCVTLTVVMFLIAAYIAVCSPSAPTIGGAVTFFGFIFVALKFKLDQASYNKDLFDRRYKIFLTVDRVLHRWCSEGKSSKELIAKVSGSLMRRSYYLFGEDTYQFINEFRRSIIYTEQKEHETQDDKFKKEIKQAREFLISVVDGQKLADKFPELKIKSY